MTQPRVGIAGYMGAGKSAAAAFLAGRGYAVIDADREAKGLMQRDGSVRGKLRDEFGAAIFDGETLVFSRLAPIVFGARDRMETLNAIVHPPLLRYLESKLGEPRQAGVVLDAALLPLWDCGDLLNVRLWVHAPQRVRLQRLARRTGLEIEALKQRMALQERMFSEPPSPPWIRIANNRSPAQLEAAVMKAVERVS